LIQRNSLENPILFVNDNPRPKLAKMVIAKLMSADVNKSSPRRI
jgi:hypothetical protein